MIWYIMSNPVTENTPEIWNELWSEKYSPGYYSWILAKEEKSIRWSRIQNSIERHFGGISGLNVIEIGAGMGTNAGLMAKNGADVTILDYSEKALTQSSEFFWANNLSANFIKADALQLPPDLIGTFDIAMSFGLAEHFRNRRRLQIIESHWDLLSKGGMAFISVPNAVNVPYRIYKWFAEKTGRWTVGEEYPFTRGEMKKICRTLGIQDFSFTADSFFYSLGFINPMHFLLLKGDKGAGARTKIRREIGTPWDPWIAYALVLCIKK